MGESWGKRGIFRMNAINLERKLSFKSKVISKVERFNTKHKRLSFLGFTYLFVSITGYNIVDYLRSNTSRFMALACILIFFAMSSSFSYPAISLGVSPAVASSVGSDVQLQKPQSVDEDDLAGDLAQVNPDVAEIESMVSGSDILVDVDPDSLSDTDTEGDVRGAARTFSSDDWKLILINKQHPIPDDYQFVLGEISSGMKCDERVIKPLYDMIKAARDDGVSLIVCSPYRDLDRQTMLFGNKVKRYMSRGMSYMDAYKLASQAVTVPGSSEHQVGLAVDIITDGYTSLDEGFGETPAGKWLAQNSSKYGFILRYPAGKEEITSIEYEPWHFRYVGVDAATVITQGNMCLEEFWSKYVD